MALAKQELVNDKFTIDDLLRRSWQFRNSADFEKFFNFIARFHHYSRYNTMLVYIQNSNVTFFGGASYWKKKFDRTIKSEARPYIILAPKGPVMLVYDILDTEGKQTPEEFLNTGLGRKPFEVTGELDDAIYDHAIQETKKWGVTVSVKPLSYFNAGYITTVHNADGNIEICLKKGLTNGENFSVLIHELAHLFLGHTGHKNLFYNNRENPTVLLDRTLSRSAEELEAETVSYLICYKLGLESRSAEYIAGYIKSEDDLFQFSYENVIRTADKIEKLFLKKLEVKYM